MSSYTATKRDADGRLIRTPMEKDPRGNYRPPSGNAGTSRANSGVSSCRGCGNNNYSAEYSYCSRCR